VVLYDTSTMTTKPSNTGPSGDVENQIYDQVDPRDQESSEEEDEKKPSQKKSVFRVPGLHKRSSTATTKTSNKTSDTPAHSPHLYEDPHASDETLRGYVPEEEPAGRSATSIEQDNDKKKRSISHGVPVPGKGTSTASTKDARPGHRGTSVFPSIQTGADRKVVGLKDYGLGMSIRKKRREWQSSKSVTGKSAKSAASENQKVKKPSVEELEEIARHKAVTNPFKLLFLGNLAALKVMGFYLITWETIITCGLTAGLTVYWYERYKDNSDWSGGGLDFILLAFAVTSPISAAIGMAFQRRERALIAIADFRSFSYHLFLGHCLWDWSENGGRAAAKDVDWLGHCDAVMAQLVGIGDEMSRFLSLPSPSRSRHRMTRTGRQEAARTMEVAYYLLESMTTQRMTRLILYSERIKKIGLPSGEASRLRQYERFLSDMIEQLRMIKLYRTPQALRSFARIFTLILPPFYAPSYAQVANEVNSLGVGIAFGIITALGLTALFESLQVLEDPFTAFLALDGIDVREEFEVLHYSQLLKTRQLVFPNAPPYPPGRRTALTSLSKPTKLQKIGMPPTQDFHIEHLARPTSVASGLTFEAEPSFVDLGDFDTGYADEELGMPILEEDERTVRESAFADDRQDSEGRGRPTLLDTEGGDLPSSLGSHRRTRTGVEGNEDFDIPRPEPHRRARTMSSAGMVSRLFLPEHM